jgi:vancomycin permeability regulator SanA
VAFLAALILLTTLAVFAANIYVIKDATQAVVFSTNKIQYHPLAMLLGTDDAESIRRRTEAALFLYDKAKFSKLIVSGNPDNHGVNEPAIIRETLEREGMPTNLIDIDETGFRTLESIRLLQRRGLTNVLLISDDYHIHRAVFLAHKLHIPVVGFAAKHPAFSATVLRSRIREYLARLNAVLETWSAE